MITNYFRSGWAVIKAEFYVTEQDARELAEPGAEPFIRAKLELLPLQGIKRKDLQRWHSTTRQEVKVTFVEGEAVIPDTLTATILMVEQQGDLGAIDAKATVMYRVLNMDEVRKAAVKAARKIFRGTK